MKQIEAMAGETTFHHDEAVPKQSVYLLSLGCPKNEVDAECMISELLRNGYRVCQRPEDADFLLVNTCAFIDAAKEEAIAAILDLAEMKETILRQTRRQAKLLVCGCLPQRYAVEIGESLPEVDAVLGTSEYHRLPEFLRELSAGKDLRFRRPAPAGSIEHLTLPHQPSADRSFAWLKIAEGCNNACAFCAIPRIRGRLRSRSIEALRREAEQFARAGFREQILISQDDTRYGEDLYGKRSLVDLLKSLLAVPELEWIRLMYLYAQTFDDELIEIMASESKILPYLDLPVQHASDRILKAMRRKETRAGLTRLLERLRARIPNLVIRTTVMLGFPGEEEEDFRELLNFIREMEFDRLGSFVFSAEEGTVAARMQGQVPHPLAEERQEELMLLQRQISRKKNLARLGSETDMILESVSEDGLFYLGRSYAEAPDVDPLIRIAAQSEEVALGSYYRCRIVDADDYDLTAITIAPSFH